MLPLSPYKVTDSTTVTCMQPTPAVDIVIFRTYRSLPALYAAYEARVRQPAQGPFRANFGNCTRGNDQRGGRLEPRFQPPKDVPHE
jgi:hypothetical protein